MKSAKTTHTSVCITQDTTESRVPRLNVRTNQILAHTFSHGTLDSVVSWAIHTLVCVVLQISLAIPTNITFWKCFCILFIYFFGRYISYNCVFSSGWRYSFINHCTAQLEGAAVLFMFSGWRTNQQQWTRVYLNACVALVHSYVCVCLCVGGWVDGWGGGYGWR